MARIFFSLLVEFKRNAVLYKWGHGQTNCTPRQISSYFFALFFFSRLLTFSKLVLGFVQQSIQKNFVMHLPQRPYLPTGNLSLFQQLCFPTIVDQDRINEAGGYQVGLLFWFIEPLFQSSASRAIKGRFMALFSVLHN